MTTQKKYIVQGTISNAKGQPLQGLYVQAYDRDPDGDTKLGLPCITNEDGFYKVIFADKDFRIGDREYDGPDLVIRVYQEEKMVAETQPKQNASSNETINITIPGEQYFVKGTVKDKANNPVPDLQVKAVRRYLRKQTPIGSGQTNEQGEYHISYFVPDADEKGLNLMFKVLDKEGKLVHRTKVHHDVAKEAKIDIRVPTAFPGFSRFERMARTLQPLLEEGLTFADLEQDDEQDDISFMSGKTCIEESMIARFVMAHKLGEMGIQPEFWFALLGGSFFQYTEDQSIKKQLESVLDSLPSLDALAVRKTLTRSFKLEEIPGTFQKKVDDWVETFLTFAASQSVKETDRPTFVKLALDHAGIKGAKKQEKFARLFNRHRALNRELLETLKEDKSFKKAEIADLRTSFRLSELTQGDFSVVKAIKEEFGVRQPGEIRSLAKKSEDQWVNLVKQKHAAGEIKLPFEVSDIQGKIKLPEAEVYGKTLERQFREAFPTTAFAGGLERARSNGGAKGLRHAEAMGKFLDLHQDFEFLNTPVDDFLKDSVHPDFESLARDEDFRLEVKAVQRVFKLAPTFEATDALLADDVHSAHQVYRMGKSEFVRRYADRGGFTKESASLAWNRAADTHAAVLTIVGDLKAREADALPRALKSGSNALSNFPNWENLFKTGDLCECEHCRSVLSPAAYFADLLMFLKDRETNNENIRVKDVLFRRRPDLGYLELNCDNALITLPYIDVVCEVLEDAVDVTSENDLELTDFNTMPDDAEAKKAKVAGKFEDAFKASVNKRKEQIQLGDDFSLSQVPSSAADKPDQWVVHGDNVTYLLKQETASSNFFAKILRNTKASADELRAYPQYVNPKAYEKLEKAKYPFTLPFDLFAREVGAAFQKTNLKRWDLMRTLRGTAEPNNPTDEEIAAEYFGISADPGAPFDEKRLILEADYTVPGQQEVWGEKNNANWLDTLNAEDEVVMNSLCNVKYFLQKTGLEYNELLALLDLEFINPAGDIAVHHLDSTCDTGQKVIRVLDASKLDRIHRFLRLWRKLDDWKMWELDLVICRRGIGSGVLDEAFLVQLFYFDQLKKRLGKKATIEQVCALFGDLNTRTHFTKLHKNREDGLYQSLFLNRRLIQPLDPAFEIDPTTNKIKPVIDLSTGLPEKDPVTGSPKLHKISEHQPVILAVLGIRESDLVLLKGLKDSDGTSYINDDLTLSNLSFIWRHAWLANMLKLKVEEWQILLKIFPHEVPNFADQAAKRSFLENKYHIKTAGLPLTKIDRLLQQIFYRKIINFACPKSAFEFLEKIDHVKSSGFEPDELNWLLVADRSAKAATKEADAARFLAGLRKELHAIRDEYNVELPKDVDSLIELLTSLLRKLNRDEAETQFFIATLLDEVKQEKKVSGLPVGFTFPESITGKTRRIPIGYTAVLSFSGRMTEKQCKTLKTDPSLSAVTGLQAYLDAIDQLFEQPGRPVVVHLPATFTFPASITGAPNHIPISYKRVMHFTGLMKSTDKKKLLEDPSLSAVTGTAAYEEVIEALFDSPRLALEFFEPVFTAPLANLPEAVDFNVLPDPGLTKKVSYDAEQRLLRFDGIMSKEEKAALDALSADQDYLEAVSSLFDQPRTIAPPDERIWLTIDDLDITKPENDTPAKRLANAADKALVYLSRTLSDNAVVQQSASQLGLTEALTRYLLTYFKLLPYLTNDFADTTDVVDYASMKTLFDGWFRVSRAAAILEKWKITLEELEKIITLTVGAQLLDFETLPLDDSGAIVSIDRFLRTSRLLRFRDRLPETGITLLEVLEKLHNREYAALAASDPTCTEQEFFAADVERLNDAWLAANVEALTTSLDISFPDDYLLAENWERLRRAFYFLDNLNAGAGTVKTFAAAAMTLTHAKTIKELLRSKFGAETWLTLSAEIQDVLRERKRDALAAYLLTRLKPADAPSGKWENTNDLYAYYLLDVEMSSCQLTSRIVQGSGSVQLFVQRCFMGLEPDVEVKAEGDDCDWRWWKWMRKYRVWEANRKVFLYPENWIEPELKKDRSPFFKDLENELLQNEINQNSVETAFSNYLEKLDGVAHLEIAGFYQEDDGDNTIIHVFGRTPGEEAHLYYYRRYDYRQWTPWEKVDLDIQGDYLIPAVVNKRLFLFWPIFTEVADEEENSKASTPNPMEGAKIKAPDADGNSMIETPNQTLDVQKAWKKLRLQMAVSEYRQGKWTPKNISEDFHESVPYTGEIVKKHYRFFPIDQIEIDGRFGIIYDGHSLDKDESDPAELKGAFEISGCKGVPERTKDLDGTFKPISQAEEASTGEKTAFMKWVELGQSDEFGRDEERTDKSDDFTLTNRTFTFKFTPVLMHTPGIFKMTPPWHLSYLDRLLLDGLKSQWKDKFPDISETVGSWLPFFYNDNKRTFFVLPSIINPMPPEKERKEGEDSSIGGSVRYYYPEIKGFFRQCNSHLEGEMQTLVNNEFAKLAPKDRPAVEKFLYGLFPEIPPPPYTDEQLKKLRVRFYMRAYHYVLGVLSIRLLDLRQSHFKNFYHPFVCDFAKLVHNPLKGIPALMSRETQLINTGFSFYQTYRPTISVVEDIPSRFSLLDIKNLPSLAAKLKQPQDNVSTYIRSQLSPVTLQALEDYQVSNPDPDLSQGNLLLENLVEDLKKIIENETVWEESRFTGVDLRPKTKWLKDLNPKGEFLIWLNRLLLEDAYPREISRDRDAYPKEVVDFSPDGAYSPYNWELFFHAPLLIANLLSKNQRFEEARDWYHFIFNPLGMESTAPDAPPMSKYWITRPFFETTDKQYDDQRIDNILRMLAGDTNVADYPAQAKKDLEDQVLDWRTNPFEPHRIANYRTVAYQRTVVMKYLDNLIAWGDYLFRQDSMESINEATQLYILAAEILGPRPKKIPPQAKPPVESFNELEKEFDKFSNALIEVENLVPLLPGNDQPGADPAPLPMLYFCIPQNDKMLGYWDTVADRLYKIRHCMNIEGVVRQLALFEPPIDPGALVKAAAAGLDISSALADLNAPLPLYRFNVLLQKANEVCSDVKALGSALLAALEKKDAEELGLKRQSQEIRLLEAVKAVREKQIEEEKENLESLKQALILVETKKTYYGEKKLLYGGEALSLRKLWEAHDYQQIAQGYAIAASIAHALPTFTVGIAGIGGTPNVSMSFGGSNVGSALQAVSAQFTYLANEKTFDANRASIMAGYMRRLEDWKHQEKLAIKEHDQLGRQIAAADLRIAIAEKELENHVIQMENAKATEEFMQSKYTNEELYQWQVGQISDVYFRSYKLAYDMAKQAERCFRFELGLQDSKYINFGYWDSLKKGLLSGEKLQYDLRRLETAYLEQNRREFELTKHISLALLDPLKLVTLRETGQCFLSLPEEIFDLDFPGHYFRRIKSVSLTLPCVVGPYTTVSCTLRLLKNSIRINTANGDNGYPRNIDEQGLPSSDERFIENNIPVKAIAASHAQNDSGVFELSFRDDRYLPFEGAGVISDWSLELFSDAEGPDFGKSLRQFDYSTISDVILHVKYTAREDAGVFKNGAVAHLRDYFSEDGAALHMFNLRQEFPNQWHTFLHPANPEDGNIFQFEMSSALFPVLHQGKTLKINRIWLIARCTNEGSYDVDMTTPSGSVEMELAPVNQYGGLHANGEDGDDVSDKGIQIIPTSPPVNWQLTMTSPSGENLQEEEVEDVILVLGYEWEED